MKKLKLLILGNERPSDTDLWIKACIEYKEYLDFRIVNLTSSNWLKEIEKESFDYLLTKPGCYTDSYKLLYDERLSILVKELNCKAFPTLNEVLIYENKRYFSFWLQANDIPHPRTNVFYDKIESLKFIKKSDYPLVAKLNIGASGHGVEILRDKIAAEKYIKEIFSKGKTSKAGPKLNKGKLISRVWQKVIHPAELIERLKIYSAIASGVQKDFVIFQEFIPHEFEWRVVRIGDSFFAHKKLIKKDKASGSLAKGYENPPVSLLNFVKNITDKFGFYSQAVDVFESKENEFLINEMQCIFGQSDPFQMLVDSKPGRYFYKDKKWIFEEGMFNKNQSYNLRLEYLLNKFNLND